MSASFGDQIAKARQIKAYVNFTEEFDSKWKLDALLGEDQAQKSVKEETVTAPRLVRAIMGL